MRFARFPLNGGNVSVTFSNGAVFQRQLLKVHAFNEITAVESADIELREIRDMTVQNDRGRDIELMAGIPDILVELAFVETSVEMVDIAGKQFFVCDSFKPYFNHINSLLIIISHSAEKIKRTHLIIFPTALAKKIRRLNCCAGGCFVLKCSGYGL